MVRRTRLCAAAVAILSAAVLGGFPAATGAASGKAGNARTAQCPWLDQRLPVVTRVSELEAAMTLDQKIAEMHVDATVTTGPYAGYEGFVPAVPSLCIPAIIEQDDSQGVGSGATGVTQLPAQVALGSAWSPSLARAYGVVNGEEHWAKGINMALGPGVNIQRDPRWGRNFEMFSEDPYLSASLGVATTEGLQSQHVMADVKHFETYNEETNRNTAADDTVVSTRALEEIYGPPFKAALVGGRAASVLCSYASYLGQFSCQSPQLLTDQLQDQWGYQGFIRSDGGGNHSTAASVNAGLDQEKGSDLFDNGLLADAVADGQVSTAAVNQALTKIFTPMFQMGLFNHPPTGNLSDTVTTPAHAAVARKVAEQGTVLLKNAGSVLPLGGRTSSIAVIGADGTTTPVTSGGGSAAVTAPYQVSPLAGIQALAGPGTTVTSYSGTDPTQAAATAASAQVAVVFASSFEQEGTDLTNINLPDSQDQYIEAVAAANPNTIVVLNTGGPVLMPWLSQVSAVLEGWYPGQEDGNALAALLFGKVDPSGHLPETFPTSLTEIPTASTAQWPGANGQVQYSEGIDVGYRWYNQNDVTPLFPFGYGLSYTTFAFSNLKVTPGRLTGLGKVQVSATVTNTGTRAGSDVAQLYLTDPAGTGEPPRQLRGFQKVNLQPGQSRRVSFTLTPHDLSWWDTDAGDGAGAWSLTPGTYQVYVGDSSALQNLPLSRSFDITASTAGRGISLSAPASTQPGEPFTVTASLSAGGTLNLDRTGLTLQTPPGWTARPSTATTARGLASAQPLTASWSVTAPAGAQDTIGQVAASASYTDAGGTGTQKTYEQVSVGSLVTSTVSPASALLAPGQTTTETLSSTNTSSYPVRLAWRAQPPAGSGVTISPQSGSVTLAPGASTTTTVQVSGSTPGSALVPFNVSTTASTRGGRVTGPAAGAYLQTTTPFASLGGTFDNIGISDDSAPTAGDLDGTGDSYSAEALAGLGITPGGSVTAGGLTFTWPDVAAGTQDNVIAAGQTVAFSGAGTTLGMLGTAVNGAFTGTATVYYTDGSTQQVSLSFVNWTNGSPPAPGVVVAKAPYLNTPTGQLTKTRFLYAAFASIDPSKTVEAVQLPSAGTGDTGIHIFAVAVGSP